MRSIRHRTLSFAMVLPLLMLFVANGLAADAVSRPGASQAVDYQAAIREEARIFLSQHPEFGRAPGNTPEARAHRTELVQQWMERVRAIVPKQATPSAAKKADWGKPRQTEHDASAAQFLPNEFVFSGIGDQLNASMTYHEVIPQEVYGAWTDMQTGFGTPPTQVWTGGTPTAGSGIPWFVFGPTPSVTGLPEAWNPSIAAVVPVSPIAYYLASVEFVAPALMPGVPSVIVVNPSMGSGLTFPSGFGPAVVFQAGPNSWVDYPYTVTDDLIGNPGPPGLGDVHVAWVEYFDGDGDPDGNMIAFDDPADGYLIWVASANSGPGPMPYPAFGNYAVLWAGPVMPRMHQVHRPSLSVVGSVPTPFLPPNGVYCAWMDAVAGMIMLEANPAPGLGGPWGIMGPAPVMPFAPLPPFLNGPFGPIKTSSNVSVAVDNGPLFAGNVYIAWSDYATGDADILFSMSPDGGFTWIPPIRVNQDPVGNGVDQWAPHMVVNPISGEIAITYYDRRNDPVNLFVETWVSTSINGGATWLDGLVSDAGPTPPITLLPPLGPALYVGDYLWSDHNPTNKWGAIWNDGRNGVDQDVFFDNVWQPDSDGDGIIDAIDNCPFAYNPGQANGDSDTYGDACDNCPAVTNQNQAITITLTGDVNADVVITSADIIFLVNYVFKGGPPPCNVCQAFGLGWSCP